MSRKENYKKEALRIIEKHREVNPNKYWDKALKEVKSKFPEEYVTKDSLSWLYRTRGKNKVIPAQRALRRDNLEGLSLLKERLLKRINRPAEVNALANILGVSKEKLILMAYELQVSGFAGIRFYTNNGKEFIHNVKKAKDYGYTTDHTEKWKNSKEIIFGLIGDTHLGSEYAAEEELEHFYDYAKELGVKDIYHAGDVFEGYKRTRAETFLGNKAIGFQAQLEYGIKNYPKRKGITTHVISGNHDEWFLEEGLADIVKTFAGRREDIEFLGNSFARVQLTPEIDMTLYHPKDGSAASVFTKLQNFILRAGKKLSKINVIGHYHKVAWISLNDVYALYPASFQKQSKWMNMNNLRSEVGAFIVRIKVSEKTGELLSINFEHVDYNYR